MGTFGSGAGCTFGSNDLTEKDYNTGNNDRVVIQTCYPDPTDYTAPAAPTRPSGIPDAPPAPECSTTQDVCNAIGIVLDDLQHMFATLGSATDERAANQTALLAQLAADQTALLTATDAIHADTAALQPLVADDISAYLGCPPAEVTGHLLAFLPAALAAMNGPLCALQPATAYTLGDSTEFTGDLELADVAGVLLVLPELTDASTVAGTYPLQRYGWYCWGTADGLDPANLAGGQLQWMTAATILLAPDALRRRLYVHLAGELVAHYRVITPT